MRMPGSPDQRRLPARAHPKITNRHAVGLLNENLLIDAFGPLAGRIDRIETAPGLQSRQLDGSRSRKQASETKNTGWASERTRLRAGNDERPLTGKPVDDPG